MDEEAHCSKIKELNATIRELENEKEEILEKLNVFMEGEDVWLFKNGKYVNEIRMVYEDLLCMGVSSRNVENVIRKVLKVVGVGVDRLPKATMAKCMLLEARSFSHMQVADELMENWDQENRTLHSDGTSKQGRSFITYDIVKDDGNCLIAGLREVSGGDSETQLKVLEDVLNDVSEMFDSCGFENNLNEGGNTKKKITKSIKNATSDKRSSITFLVATGKKSYHRLFKSGKTCQKMRKKRWQMSTNFFVVYIFLLGLLIRQKLAAKFGIIFVGGIQKLVHLPMVVTVKENLGFIV